MVSAGYSVQRDADNLIDRRFEGIHGPGGLSPSRIHIPGPQKVVAKKTTPAFRQQRRSARAVCGKQRIYLQNRWAAPTRSNGTCQARFPATSRTTDQPRAATSRIDPRSSTRGHHRTMEALATSTQKRLLPLTWAPIWRSGAKDMSHSHRSVQKLIAARRLAPKYKDPKAAAAAFLTHPRDRQQVRSPRPH